MTNILPTYCSRTVCQSMHIKLNQNLWNTPLQFLNSTKIILHCTASLATASASSVYIKIPPQCPPGPCLSAYLCLSAGQHIQLDMGGPGRGTLDHIKCAIHGPTSPPIFSSNRSSKNGLGNPLYSSLIILFLFLSKNIAFTKRHNIIGGCSWSSA